ncbi:MAG: M20/M25/M40 family metallo-hydrolase [Candidatus Rhabdochlamydia sp.]
MKIQLEHLEKWYQDHLEQILDRYFAFLKIPSISTDPLFSSSVQEACDFVIHQLQAMHFHVERWETSKYPVIFATYETDPSHPTLLIYHHYDVQPADPVHEWHFPPFEPTLQDGAVYARGSSDNKGQLIYTLAAIEAYHELLTSGKINLKLFIEGEEECGSLGPLEILKDKQQPLQANHVLIIDALIPSLETPAITLGLRGLLTLEVICSNSHTDLHSGSLGGIALNPNQALITLLASCWDAHHNVVIPGFYDHITPLTSEEKEGMVSEVDISLLQQQFGLTAFQSPSSKTLWEKNTLLPTLEINGISGGYTGAGFKTVIPATASAKISCRLAQGQDPEEMFNHIVNFFKSQICPGISLEVRYLSGAQGVRSSSDTSLARICANSYSEVFNTPCQQILSGASIPLVTHLAACSHAEVVMMGMILDTDCIHAPNEHFSLQQLRKGFLTVATLLGNLSSC